MDVRTIGVVIVIAVIAASLAAPGIRRRLTERYSRRFMAGDFEGCLKLLDGPVASFAIPKYNLNYLRLNVYEATGDDEKAAATIEAMLRLRVNEEQRAALLDRAFGFYAGQGDRECAGHMLELMESLGNKDLLMRARKEYNIHFKGSCAYIPEMERALEGASADVAAKLCYLLSLQYANKGDKARAQAYLKRAAGEA